MIEPCDFEAIVREERPQAVRIAEFLYARLPGNVTVVDVGCGPGIYVEEMLRLGMNAVGVDNDPRADAPYISKVDLSSYDWQPIIAADVALSLEVGEHIPEELCYRYVDFLSATGAECIYFSAARPGQGGRGHINCQNKLYWVRRMHAAGYCFDPDETEAWMDHMSAGYHMGWLVQNGMVFRKVR